MCYNNVKRVVYAVVGQRVRAARKERGFTQKRLAEMLGLSTFTRHKLSKIENGHPASSIQEFRALFSALKKPPTYFY